MGRGGRDGKRAECLTVYWEGIMKETGWINKIYEIQFLSSSAVVNDSAHGRRKVCGVHGAGLGGDGVDVGGDQIVPSVALIGQLDRELSTHPN